MNQEPSTRIHENAIKAWTVNALLYGLLFFAPTIIYTVLSVNYNIDNGISWYNGINWLIFSGMALVSLVFYLMTAILLPKIRWKRWRYDVSEKEIDMLRGIFIKKRTLVPINRVQHVDTRQGPIYRRFGLSSVAISTAATTHEIPALDDETANELRTSISVLVQKVKDDV
jgi:membrane protein YdbS with pleckstrin-like domain